MCLRCFAFDLQTDTRFVLQQLLLPEGRRCKNFSVRNCCNKNLMSRWTNGIPSMKVPFIHGHADVSRWFSDCTEVTMGLTDVDMRHQTRPSLFPIIACQHQAIIWTNAGLFTVEPLGTVRSVRFEWKTKKQTNIQINDYENVCKMPAILSQPQCVKYWLLCVASSSFHFIYLCGWEKGLYMCMILWFQSSSFSSLWMSQNGLPSHQIYILYHK